MNITKIVLITIAVISALGIYPFNTPGRNPLVNIGAGLWDTYNMATGILGDTLSYIRLYALGLAGGMLGGAFNNLGRIVFKRLIRIITYIFPVFFEKCDDKGINEAVSADILFHMRIVVIETDYVINVKNRIYYFVIV